MKINIHSYPTKISWEHCSICQKKNTEGMKTRKKLLENLENNLIKFWKYGKLELNWEALTELNENGKPNFFDSFIKHDAKFHWKSGTKFDNQKVQRLMKLQEKSKNPNLLLLIVLKQRRYLLVFSVQYAVRIILVITCMQLCLFMQLKQTLIPIIIPNYQINGKRWLQKLEIRPCSIY